MALDRSDAIATHLGVACMYIREQWSDPKTRIRKIQEFADKMKAKINDEEMWAQGKLSRAAKEGEHG